MKYFLIILLFFLINKNYENKWGLGIGDWGLGIGDWELSLKCLKY